MNDLDVDDCDEFYREDLIFRKSSLEVSDIYCDRTACERSSLIKDLEDKWDQIERNKRLSKSGTKRSTNESRLFDGKSSKHKSVFNMRVDRSSSPKRGHDYDNKVKTYRKKRRLENEDSGEFDEFIAYKINELEQYKTEHILSNNKYDSRGSHLDVVQETNSVKGGDSVNYEHVGGIKSFLKRDEDISTHKNYLEYNMNSNIEEILTPSKTLLTKMQNIYGLVSTSHDNKPEVEDGGHYSLNSLERNFEDIVSKINPNLKLKKFDMAEHQPKKPTTDQRLIGLIDESTKGLKRDDGSHNRQQIPSYHKNDRVYSKNNFDKVNGKLSLVKCTKLKKLLDLNKNI
jgi:hypothetical protein